MVRAAGKGRDDADGDDRQGIWSQPAGPAQGPHPAGLVDAAVRLIAEGRGERASIQEITEAADIGFGSFYNHFESKEELFRTASEEVLERWGQMIDRACAGLDDPAEVFTTSFRISGRLGWTHPDLARFITGAGLELLDRPRGLAPARCATSRWAKPPDASPCPTPTSP